jgi:hypothetical protein
VIERGQSFLIPSGPDDKKHLHFIVVGPCVFPDYGCQPHVLLVSVTTLYNEDYHDPACVLEAGEHPFVRHKSYIDYRKAMIQPVAHVEKMRDQGVWSEHGKCSPAVLEKIYNGIFVSPRVKRFVQEILKSLK